MQKPGFRADEKDSVADPEEVLTDGDRDAQSLLEDDSSSAEEPSDVENPPEKPPTQFPVDAVGIPSLRAYGKALPSRSMCIVCKSSIAQGVWRFQVLEPGQVV